MVGPNGRNLLRPFSDSLLQRMHIRANGSAGTHNGMKSVLACAGSAVFGRAAPA